MQTSPQEAKRKSARPTVRRRQPAALAADAYLRSDAANERAVTEAIKAAERGELLEFDPRKK